MASGKVVYPFEKHVIFIPGDFKINVLLHLVTFLKILFYSKLQASSDEENNSIGSDDDKFSENEGDDEELPTPESDEVCQLRYLALYLRC